MMKELGPTTRSLVASARAGLGPDAAAAARVRARVAAAVGGGALGVAASAPKVGAAVGAKITGALLVAAAIVVVVGHGGTKPSTVPAIAPPRASLDDEPRADVRVVAPEALPQRDPVRARPVIAPRAPVAEPASLAREVELIDLAMRSMRDHAPSGALDTIRVYLRETGGHGQLAEDAAAIEIEATCVLHDASATDKLAAFDAKWPRSAQRSRLTAACN